jgi:rare lipoprotein A
MMQHLNVIVVLMIAGLLTACANRQPPPSVAIAPATGRPIFTQVGMASWYGKNHDGKTTANGETFDMDALTAAHRTLPFGTVVRVTNLATKRTIKVRINDRGPYAEGRIIDLSARAARDLGIADHGVARVRIEQFASDQTAGS